MAKFLGMVKGARGAASRLGTSNSGITASAQSWGGSVQVQLYERDGATVCRLTSSEGSSFHGNTLLFDGSLDELEQILGAARG